MRGAYPYVLQQLLTPEGDENTPEALRKLLVRLLTVNGEGMLHNSIKNYNVKILFMVFI